MKSKFITALLCAAAVCAAGALAACNSEQGCDHTWNVGVVTTQATCAAAGEKTYTCTTCGETKTEVIEKTEHPHSADWLHNDDEHWQKATCEHDTEQVNAGAHAWDEGTVVTAATCLKTGLMRYSCICGLTRTQIIQKTEHPYAENLTWDDGEHWRVCTTQGCTHTSDKTAHNWDGGEITSPATCLSEGVKTYTCTDCKKTRTETVAIANHSYGSDWVKDENGHYHACTTEGCGEKSDEGTHTFGEWSTKGRIYRPCTVCEYEELAPALTTTDENSEYYDQLTKVTVTVGGGEKVAINVFAMAFYYYTVTYSGSAPVKVVCEYDDKDGNPIHHEYTLTTSNNTFTEKLPDRSIACLFVESDAETAFECTLRLSVSVTAPKHTHNYSEEWSTDADQHWHACTTGADCEDMDVGMHDFGDGDVCPVCGYDKTAATE